MDEIEFNRTLNESAQLLRQNRPGEAESKLLPLYEDAPDHADVLINLSGAYILQRKWDKAVKLLKKGTKSNPNNAMLLMNMGAAELGRLETAGPKQQEKAIQAYQRALQVNAETPNAHYSLGLIYKERGELLRATAFFQRALEVDPADRDAQYWLDKLAAMSEMASKSNDTSDELSDNVSNDVSNDVSDDEDGNGVDELIADLFRDLEDDPDEESR
jgi:tetratricopeptide (TPR) repeat protein